VPVQLARLLADRTPQITLLNAGDGSNEDPTEALAHMITVQRYCDVTRLRILFVGDLLSSAVVRSMAFGFGKLAANVHVLAPSGMLPITAPAEMNVVLHRNLSAALPPPDVLISVPFSKATIRKALLQEDEVLTFMSLR